MSAKSLTKFEKSYANANQDNRIYKVRLVYDRAGTTTPVGVLNTTVAMDPSFSPEWATWSTLYDEFRVMGSRINLVSKQQGTVTNPTDLAVVAFDNDDIAPLGSVSDGMQHSTSHLFSAIWYHNIIGENKSSVLSYSAMRPTSGKNTSVDWIDVASPGNSLGGWKFYAQGLANSTQYLAIGVEWFVEFRGRR